MTLYSYMFSEVEESVTDVMRYSHKVTLFSVILKIYMSRGTRDTFFIFICFWGQEIHSRHCIHTRLPRLGYLQNPGQLRLKRYLGYRRLCNWDSHNFFVMFSRLMNLLPTFLQGYLSLVTSKFRVSFRAKRFSGYRRLCNRHFHNFFIFCLRGQEIFWRHSYKAIS